MAAFESEAAMLPTVRDWLRGQGLMVREEFTTPFGIPDLVGCELDPARARKRRAILGHSRPLGPSLRIALWNRIPPASSRRSVPLADLVALYEGLVSSSAIEREIDLLIEKHFVVINRRGRLVRCSEWHPLHRRVIAVELKLNRFTDALAQARSYRAFATGSYVALPADYAEYVMRERKNSLKRSRVGLLAVAQGGVRELLKPRPPFRTDTDRVALTHTVERFWQTYNLHAMNH